MHILTKKIISNISLLGIFALGAVLRLYNLNWDNGLYLHPDERLFVNASNLLLPTSWSNFFSIQSPLNPHMFYYGSFLLYLYKFVHEIFFPYASFLIVSRGISALFSILTILVVNAIGKELFSKKVGLLSALVFVFSVGSIQYAHFNTTESLLILLVALITYISIVVVRSQRYSLFLLLGLLCGISYATKITGAIFVMMPLFSFLCLLLITTKKKTLFLWLFAFSFVAIVTGVVAAPYQVIDYQHFVSQTSYMQDVTYGRAKPPFAIIYEHTIPFLYQVAYVFPFIFGFISFPISLLGLTLLVKKLHKKENILMLFLFLFPVLYFLWSGAWYAKFGRYYLLLLPFMAIWAGYFLSQLKKYLLFILVFCIALNGILYLRVYSQTHTRITASEWMYASIPTGSVIATEHWDDALPLLLSDELPEKVFANQTLHVYDIDTAEKVSILAQQLSESDYLVLSSRRVYESILHNPTLYPYTNQYYHLLLENKLGYRQVARFTNYPFFFSDDVADETFQSYDHPPVVIFKNTHSLPASQIEKLILH